MRIKFNFNFAQSFLLHRLQRIGKQPYKYGISLEKVITYTLLI